MTDLERKWFGKTAAPSSSTELTVLMSNKGKEVFDLMFDYPSTDRVIDRVQAAMLKAVKSTFRGHKVKRGDGSWSYEVGRYYYITSKGIEVGGWADIVYLPEGVYKGEKGNGRFYFEGSEYDRDPPGWHRVEVSTLGKNIVLCTWKELASDPKLLNLVVDHFELRKEVDRINSLLASVHKSIAPKIKALANPPTEGGPEFKSYLNDLKALCKEIQGL